MMPHMQQQQQEREREQEQQQQQQSALPPWPFSRPFQGASANMGMAPPLPPTGRQNGDPCLQQVLAVTMMQQMPMTPGGAQSSGASISTMPGGAPGATGAEPFGKQQPQQQQPFSMPMPPPHDMAYCGAMGQPPQTYFENWASASGQQHAGAGMQMSAGSPMGAMMGGNMQIGSSAQGLFLS